VSRAERDARGAKSKSSWVQSFALPARTGWQIGASELANYELKDDLKDLASQNSACIGLAAPRSDDDRREAVIGVVRRKY